MPCVCVCVFVIVTQWLGQEFNSQQFWRNKLFLFLDFKPAKYTYLVFVLCICNSNPMVGTRV